MNSEDVNYLWESIWLGFSSPDEISKQLKYDIKGKELTQEQRDRIITELFEIKRKLFEKFDSDHFYKLDNVFRNLNLKGIISVHNCGMSMSDGHSGISEIEHNILMEAVSRKMVFDHSQLIGYCFYHYQDIEFFVPERTSAIIPTGNLSLAFGALHNDSNESYIKIGETICDQLTSGGLNFNWKNSSRSRIEILDFQWRKETNMVSWSMDKIICEILGEKPDVTDNIQFSIGQEVNLIGGPFKGFKGIVQNVRKSQRKLKLKTSIFGRENEIEVDYDEVVKQK